MAFLHQNQFATLDDTDVVNDYEDEDDDDDDDDDGDGAVLDDDSDCDLFRSDSEDEGLVDDNQSNNNNDNNNIIHNHNDDESSVLDDGSSEISTVSSSSDGLTERPESIPNQIQNRKRKSRRSKIVGKKTNTKDPLPELFSYLNNMSNNDIKLRSEDDTGDNITQNIVDSNLQKIAQQCLQHANNGEFMKQRKSRRPGRKNRKNSNQNGQNMNQTEADNDDDLVEREFSKEYFATFMGREEPDVPDDQVGVTSGAKKKSSPNNKSLKSEFNNLRRLKEDRAMNRGFNFFGRKMFEQFIKFNFKRSNRYKFEQRFNHYLRETYPKYDHIYKFSNTKIPTAYETANDYVGYWEPFVCHSVVDHAINSFLEPAENILLYVEDIENDTSTDYIRVKTLLGIDNNFSVMDEDNLALYSSSFVVISDRLLEDKTSIYDLVFGTTVAIDLKNQIVKRLSDLKPENIADFQDNENVKYFLTEEKEFREFHLLLPKNENFQFIQKDRIIIMNMICSYFLQSLFLDNLLRINNNPMFLENFLTPKVMDKLPANKVPVTNYYYDLNEKQKKIINNVLGCINNPKNRILQLHGPPGSGKTHTILSLLTLVFERYPDARVMVCAPSNTAVDEIGCRVIHNKRLMGILRSRNRTTNSSVQIIRTGRKEKIHEDMLGYRSFKYPVDEPILVFSTLSSCQPRGMASRIAETHFDLIIVDEAGNSVEIETLMVIPFNCKTYLLVGDHKQLQPTVLSIPNASRGYNVSFFERSQKIKDHYQDLSTILLENQYRMKPPICEIPSNHFYDGRLKTIAGSGEHPAVRLFPLTCFNVYDSEEREVYSGKANKREASFIVNLLKEIVSKHGTDVSIGIICFYRAQIMEVLERCKKSGIRMSDHRNVVINTVDSFQGQERDIIIISCTRSNFDKDIGFTISPNRLNVALTRAKSALFLVLNQSTFDGNRTWKKVIDDFYCQRRLFTVDHHYDSFHETIVQQRLPLYTP